MYFVFRIHYVYRRKDRQSIFLSLFCYCEVDSGLVNNVVKRGKEGGKRVGFMKCGKTRQEMGLMND